MKRALVIIAIALLAVLASPAMPVAACPPDDDCGDSWDGPAIFGPQGPEAFQDLSTGLYTFNDGSTADSYEPPSWSPPSFADLVERAISSFEHLFDRFDSNAESGGYRD